MNLWYPVIPRRLILPTVRIALLGAVVAGLYGAVHDQISYSISPEYFTKMKFYQFAYADFGWPQRVFAAEIGFLASWYVGLVAGWILARLDLAELSVASGRRHVAKAVAILLIVAALSGCVGALIGVWATHDDLTPWQDWQTYFRLQDLRAFVIVAYLHRASYLGAVLGLLCAGVYVKKSNAAVPKE